MEPTELCTSIYISVSYITTLFLARQWPWFDKRLVLVTVFELISSLNILKKLGLLLSWKAIIYIYIGYLFQELHNTNLKFHSGNSTLQRCIARLSEYSNSGVEREMNRKLRIYILWACNFLTGTRRGHYFLYNLVLIYRYWRFSYTKILKRLTTLILL
jgi:hypothetical protein